MRRLLLISALAACALTGALAPAAASARERWDTRVFALVPRPGFPAHAYVHPNGRVYEGTYVNPMGDNRASRVFEFDADGTLLRSWRVHGQDIDAEHGVQVATSDARGRLVLLDRTPARVLILDRSTGGQHVYATFADLPTCPADGPCSQAMRDLPPMANYAAWAPDGALFVTDYQQGVIWRVPPGGGEAQVWLSDVRLSGDMFGTAGLVLTADRTSLLVAQGSSAGFGEPNPTTGKLYSVPIGPDGRPGEMRLLWESGIADAPDGFALAKSGRVYMALVGPASQLVAIAPDGTEEERFPSQPLSGDNGSPVPFDSPSSARFLGTRLVVANQAFATGDPAHQAILDVEVGEEGVPELIPANAGLRPGERAAGAPAKAKAKKAKKAKRKKAKRRCKRASRGERRCRRR